MSQTYLAQALVSENGKEKPTSVVIREDNMDIAMQALEAKHPNAHTFKYVSIVEWTSLGR